MSFFENKRDPTRKEVPINPPDRSSEDLWRAMNKQCSISAGLGVGPDEKELITQNNDQSPSEIKRIKESTK